MEEVSKINSQRFVQRVPDESYQKLFESQISNLDEKLSQIVINEENNSLTMYITSIHKVYKIHSNVVTSITKDSVESACASKGVPNGKLKISFVSGDEWNLNNIIFGRAYDFVQDVKPKDINMANYDNTIRGQFPQLLDPDHAEEIDRLRKWMQDGHISHYEFDDANPAYPKAGK
ncbi:histidine decarboxylase maturation protein HdcB [uncultured Clostridium sp.]|uniref:histidine decarboxylase maturation protein HdcB n=1 Tax=uncultured Clostridium sp. TaxID=59620 RepID=UPI002607A27F|nr:histidine decarboxylase maturation protein HdcB [uncultured Clostridium sp.]